MNKQKIRWLIVFGTLTMVCVAVAQIYWVTRAIKLEEQALNQKLHVALLTAAKNLAATGNFALGTVNPVNQLASNYYVVDINNTIDANLLEYFLNDAFVKSNVVLDYEYGIYDCSSDEMVYGNYVGQGHAKSARQLPKWQDNIYYFGVRFPQVNGYLYGQLDTWVITSIIICIALVFFSYALFVILKQKRLSEVQKEFVDNLTHEFKTPLSTMAISTNVLATANQVKRSARLSRYAGILAEEIAQLKSQVDVLLQMTDIEKEAIELNLEAIVLDQFLARIADSIQLRIAQENGQFLVQNNVIGATITADRMHLTNILYGLLDNAIKYSTTKPEIQVVVSKEKGAIAIAVKDRGKGIAAEHQQKIFKKFYRISTGNVHDVKGFGLGLSYINKLVLAHGWRLTLTSQLNHGSTFTIHIPHG